MIKKIQPKDMRHLLVQPQEFGTSFAPSESFNNAFIEKHSVNRDTCVPVDDDTTKKDILALKEDICNIKNSLEANITSGDVNEFMQDIGSRVHHAERLIDHLRGVEDGGPSKLERMSLDINRLGSSVSSLREALRELQDGFKPSGGGGSATRSLYECKACGYRMHSSALRPRCTQCQCSRMAIVAAV